MDNSLMTKVIIAVIIIYTYIYFKYNLERNVGWNHYVESLYYLGIFLIVASFIHKHISEEEDIRKNEIKTIAAEKEQFLINIEKTLIDYYPESVYLSNQMYPAEAVKIPPKIDEIKRKMVELHLCNIILQKIENTYLISLNTSLEKSQQFQDWIKIWRMWFKSPILVDVWNKNKNALYSDRFRNFVETKLI